MKVLINCLSSISGGALSYLRNILPPLCEQFDRSSGVHSLCVLAHNSQRELINLSAGTEQVWVGGVHPTSWRRLIWERRHVSRIASDVAADVVFTPYQIGPRVIGLKQVLMIRNMEPFHFKRYPYSTKSWLRNKILYGQTSKALRMADRVIAVSGFAEDCVKNALNVPANQVRRIYHGRDSAFSSIGDLEDDWAKLHNLNVHGDFLLTCGSILPYRRCEDIIDAFDAVTEGSDQGLLLVIAGTGSDVRYAEKIHKKIDASSYKNRILAIGHVPKESMIALYRQCKLCVVATEIEACPNIAIEAMSSGCAIISADNPPLPEMFYGSSLEFIPRDVTDLSTKIQHLLNDEQLRRDYCRRGQERALAFSWTRCAQETYSALIEWPEGYKLYGLHQSEHSL